MPGRGGESTATTELKSRCKRCHRPFKPKKEGQVYGSTCARKMAGQHTMEDGTIECRDEKGELTAVIF